MAQDIKNMISTNMDNTDSSEPDNIPRSTQASLSPGNTVTVNQSSPSFNHLVIVCCHAIYSGNGAGEVESDWLTEPFQKGETPTFLAHIQKGIDIISARPNSLLMFSGGHTKPELTDLSEAESYLTLAHALLPTSSLLTTHLTTETHSTDSHQNLLFSILKYHTLTQTYPPSLTLITHLFKRSRFLNLHASAIRYPLSKIEFIGIDPPEKVTSGESLRRGEEKNGYGVWKGDLYGCGKVLREKRQRRGWKLEDLKDVEEGVEEGVRALCRWEGGESGVEIFEGILPWDVSRELRGSLVEE